MVLARRGDECPSLFEAEIRIFTKRNTLAFCFFQAASAIALAAPAQILGCQSGDCAGLHEGCVGVCPLCPRFSCYRKRKGLGLVFWTHIPTSGFSCTTAETSCTGLLTACAVAWALQSIQSEINAGAVFILGWLPHRAAYYTPWTFAWHVAACAVASKDR